MQNYLLCRLLLMNIREHYNLKYLKYKNVFKKKFIKWLQYNINPLMHDIANKLHAHFFRKYCIFLHIIQKVFIPSCREKT